MNSSIFSTFSQGENRITSQFFEVLFQLSYSTSNKIIRFILDNEKFDVVEKKNQYKTDKYSSVPDYMIRSKFNILVETKNKSGLINEKQIKEHIKVLEDEVCGNDYLLVLTPDGERPPLLDKVGDDRICWCSFESIYDFIDSEILNNSSIFVSEHEVYLLKHIMQFFREENLCKVVKKEVVIVAAKGAWPEYEKFSAYICPVNRNFSNIEYIAFYAGNEIKPCVAKILKHYSRVDFSAGSDNGDSKLNELVGRISVEGNFDRSGNFQQIFILSDKSSEDTFLLSAPLENDCVKDGKRVAAVQKFMYTTLKALESSRTISDLKAVTKLK